MVSVVVKIPEQTAWFLMEIDSEGEQLWYRTDSFYLEGEGKAAASASEYDLNRR